MKNKKELSRIKRHKHLRIKIYGTAERPRLVLHRSIKNFVAQLVDDINGKTLFSLTTFNKDIKQKFPAAGNIKAAVFFGQEFALKAKEKGFTKVVFDRAGFKYHGRVKAFADSARKNGLEF